MSEFYACSWLNAPTVSECNSSGRGRTTPAAVHLVRYYGNDTAQDNREQAQNGVQTYFKFLRASGGIRRSGVVPIVSSYLAYLPIYRMFKGNGVAQYVRPF